MQLRLQRIIALYNQLDAELCYDNNYGIILTSDDFDEVLWSETPWIVEDFPSLAWRGNLLFHRGHGTVYLVNNQRDFNNSIYRSRLQGFQKMVGWASTQPVGFTVDEKVEEIWGYLLINPWVVKSTDNRWLQRIKVFAALSEFDPELWPMSLLIKKWDEVRKIIF